MHHHGSRHTMVGVFVMAAAIAPSNGQIPPHATLLSAQFGLEAPRVAQQDDTVHVFARVTATGPRTVLHWRSEDGGRTWPFTERPLTPLTLGLELADLHVAPDRVLVLVVDPVAGPSLLRSSDAGTTWSAPIPIASTVVPQPAPMLAAMCVDGASVVVAWTNDRIANRLFCKRSTDGGLTWPGNDVPLDSGAVVLAGYPVERVRCLGAGGVVHVLWGGQFSTGRPTLHQRSLDGGASWRPLPVQVSNAPTERAVTDGANALVVDIVGPPMRSADFGDTWAPVANSAVRYSRDLAIDGSRVLSVGFTQGNSYVFDVSSDGGATWLPSPLQVPVSGLFLRPRAHFGGGHAWAHFVDDITSTTPYIGVLASPDAGLTWQVVGGPAEVAFAAGPRRTLHVARSASPTGWRYSIYPAVGSSRVGAATIGSGGHAPELTTVHLPLQGGTTTLQADRLVGGAVGALGVSFAAPAPTALGTGTLWLTGPVVLVGFAASGASGMPGAGSFGLPLVVPIAPALVGQRLTAQALGLDAGTADGFTLTNAVEVWLR